jgi:hypothetical protein
MNAFKSIAVAPEVDLLLHCARTQIEPERAERIRELSLTDLDWDWLLQLSQRNGLTPLLFFHLNLLCPTSVPPKPQQFLRDYAQKNSAFNLLLTGGLLRVLKVFEANGITGLPYKGPATAVRVYGNLQHRQFGDLDILVRERDVWKATELLVGEGFEPHFVIPPKKQQAFTRLSYVRLFRRDAGRTLVELHWRIAPRFFSIKFDEAGLWCRLEQLNLMGVPVATPAAEDLLLMLCIHGAKDCWERLEWVTCVAELIRKTDELDWKFVWQKAREMHCERMVKLGVLLAHSLLEVPLPADVSARISTDRKLPASIEKIAHGFFAEAPPERSFRYRLAFHLALKDNAIDKLRHSVRLAITTTPVDWAMTPLPAPLSFVYPLLRAVRLTKKYGLNPDQVRE